MNTSAGSFRFNHLMWVPIGGWLYLGWGVVWPFDVTVLQIIWWIDLFLSVVVHLAQVPLGIRLGRPQGFSPGQSAVWTFIFGATWWRPLQLASTATTHEQQ